MLPGQPSERASELKSNTHLRTLLCSCSNVSATFGRDVLLPAVRTNTSLRRLEAGGDMIITAAQHDQQLAEAMVGGRACCWLACCRRDGGQR